MNEDLGEGITDSMLELQTIQETKYGTGEVGQLERQVTILTKSNQTNRKKYEYFKSKTNKKLETKDQEIQTIREQLVEKDKAIRLAEVKLKEMYALQLPLLQDSNVANEVHDLLFKEEANFSGNYLKLR